MTFISNLPLLLQSLFAGMFTFILTSLGASIVFLIKKVKPTFMNYMLALSSGIMMSASFFSLIIPAIESLKYNNHVVLFTIVGFLSGCLFLYFSNLFFDKYCITKNYSKFKHCILLFFSITLHNIPEGLVLGVAFGSVYYNSSSLFAAIALTLGIGIQNFPEGAAISLPLRREGLSAKKAFIFGVLSGLVEPLFAVIGALLVLKIKKLLPVIMLFTAGAMFFVIIVELIPESQKNKKEGFTALLNLMGFTLMMLLELLFD